MTHLWITSLFDHSWFMFNHSWFMFDHSWFMFDHSWFISNIQNARVDILLEIITNLVVVNSFPPTLRVSHSVHDDAVPDDRFLVCPLIGTLSSFLDTEGDTAVDFNGAVRKN
jgi:hypothetical protein